MHFLFIKSFTFFLIILAYSSQGFAQKNNVNTSKNSNNSTVLSHVVSTASESTVIVEDKNGRKILGFSYWNGVGKDLKTLNSSWIVTTSVSSKSDVFVYFSGVRIKAEVKYIDQESDISILFLDNTVIKPIATDSVSEVQQFNGAIFFASELSNNKIGHLLGSIPRAQRISGIDFWEFSSPNFKNQNLGALFNSQGNIVGLISNKYKPSDTSVLAIPFQFIKTLRESLVAAEIIKILTIDDKYKESFGDDFVKWLYSGGEKNPQQYLIQYSDAQKIIDSQASDKIEKYQKALYEIAQVFYAQKNKVSSNQQPIEKNITLICQLFSQSRDHRQQATYHIDFAASTVNKYAATITDNQIAYSHTNGSSTYSTRIDRVSGFAVVGSGQFPMLLSGNCTKSEGRSF